MRRTFGGHLERLSRWGAWLGAWNDPHVARSERWSDVPLWRRLVDRLASWLYVRPDVWGKR